MQNEKNFIKKDACQSAYARQEERVETIKGLFTKEQIIDLLTQNLNLSQQEADNAYNQAMATA